MHFVKAAECDGNQRAKRDPKRKTRVPKELKKACAGRQRNGKKPDGDGQNQIGQDDGRENCEPEKHNQQSGLLSRVRFSVKKVHELQMACSKRNGLGKTLFTDAK
jgi:hypothetical protein